MERFTGKAAADLRVFLGEPPREELRYERKFLAPDELCPQILAGLRTHPAFFREVYPPRFVNNIYLDDPDHHRYRESVDGRSDRTKVRVRWYGDLTGAVATPTLEFKHKRGMVGWKNTIGLSGFNLAAGSRLAEIMRDVERSCRAIGTSLELDGYRPVLVNRYRRKYFESADRVFRVTVDTGLCFFRLGQGYVLAPARAEYSRETVLELKYSHDAEANAAAITEGIPLRLAKNSKFVVGIGWLHGVRAQ